MCALKGMLRQSIQRIKAMLLCIVYDILFVDMLLCIVYGMLFVDIVNMKIKACNALNAMFVDTVNTGVCSIYTTLYTEYYEVWKLYSTLYEPEASHPVGLAVHQSVRGGSLVKFLGLVKNTTVITGKMHSQFPILRTKGVLSNLVILTYLQTKLLPLYPNQTACL